MYMNKVIETKGLSSQEAASRLVQYGENVLVKKKKLKPVEAFIQKFKSPLILILIAASVVSIFLGMHTDAIIILVMVFLSAILDFFNTRKSEKAVGDLIAKVAITARVRRDGKEKEIQIKDIVPGDIVILTAGDVVPADCRILEAKDFFVNQSALTGESFPVEKRAQNNEAADEASTTEIIDGVFMGSSVVTGYATVEVEKTGRSTHYGKIAERLLAATTESDFEKGIRHFSFFILQVTFILVVLVFFINAFVHRGILESFIFALAIAVGLTPELLPVIISIALSHGSLKMSKKEVIVKNLYSIQNLGSMNVLCTDKTGTLTEDKIALVKYVDGAGNVSKNVLFHSYLTSIFHTGVKNPFDSAVKNFERLDIKGCKKIDEIPFDFMRRRDSIVVEKDGKRIFITKGAPEWIFKIISKYQKGARVVDFDKACQKEAQTEFDALSKDGFRVLAVASKEVAYQKGAYTYKEEHDMTFLGFVAFYDPPKQTAGEAVKELEELGVEVKILTGDNALLTEKICRDIKLPIKGTLLGDHLNEMSDSELEPKVLSTTIFARISPEQKERIILILKKMNYSVGYLGDGINDAPALKAADVGISVNNAVDVAKETAGIILLRKSLGVLRDGVLEGRQTFQNTLKYIMMGLSSNFGNMFSMTGLSALLPFFPMLPSQVLLNNLMYDVSQFTLPTDKVDFEDVKKPLRWNMKFIRKYMFAFGPISSVFDFLTFGAMFYIFHLQAHQFQTAWFIESLATQTFVIYVIRTKKIPFLQSSPSRLLILSTLSVVALAVILPYLPVGPLLQFAPLSVTLLAVIAGLVFVYLWCVQGVKVIFYKKMKEGMERTTSEI